MAERLIKDLSLDELNDLRTRLNIASVKGMNITGLMWSKNSVSNAEKQLKKFEMELKKNEKKKTLRDIKVFNK